MTIVFLLPLTHKPLELVIRALFLVIAQGDEHNVFSWRGALTKDSYLCKI